MYVFMYICMYVCEYVNMHLCMYIRMYVCMYVYIYIYVPELVWAVRHCPSNILYMYKGHGSSTWRTALTEVKPNSLSLQLLVRSRQLTVGSCP